MKNPQVDAYIARQAGFARPILEKLRALFHKALPDVREELKWGFPHFVRGRIVGTIAGFKAHVSYGFWQARQMKDPHKLLKGVGNTDMNAARTRITSIDDLPADGVLIDYVKQAGALAAAPPPARPRVKPRGEVTIPPYVRAALKKNPKAQAAFDAFPPSHRREYVEWIVEAKQEATRAKRLETAIKWMSEGKSRHWRYAAKQ